MTSSPTVAPMAVAQDLGCAKLLSQAEAVAVLGLPLDGLGIADVRDLPSPQVGRTDRETCTYTAVSPVWPVKGVVLVVTVGWFVDPTSARAQHDRNVVDAAAGAAAAVPERLGAATVAVVARPDRTVLLSVYRRISVDAEVINAVGGARGPRRAGRRRPTRAGPARGRAIGSLIGEGGQSDGGAVGEANSAVGRVGARGVRDSAVGRCRSCSATSGFAMVSVGSTGGGSTQPCCG